MVHNAQITLYIGIPVFITSKLHQKEKKKEFLDFDPNTKLAAVYYNGGKPTHLFRIRNDVTLFGLKDKLDQINHQLNHRDTRRVVGAEYRCPLSDSAGSLRFSQMKLTNHHDVRTMFFVFGQHSTRGPIEIRALLEGPDEEISLGDT